MASASDVLRSLFQDSKNSHTRRTERDHKNFSNYDHLSQTESTGLSDQLFGSG